MDNPTVLPLTTRILRSKTRRPRDLPEDERLPDLDRLGETARVDLLRIHDPREGETDHVLLGVEFVESQRQDLRFHPSVDIRYLGPALIYAFERLGGLPAVVELPLILPFYRMVEGGPPALHPELDGFAHAFRLLFLFPSLHEYPDPWWGSHLEISFRRVVKEFLPGRSPESLSARNRALALWLEERRKPGGGSPPARHQLPPGRRVS